KWWLKQFKQWTGTAEEIQAVDGISGATVSVHAFVDDLKALVLEHHSHGSDQ
ncbi:MAG: FMN-binding protein, partial [Schleiferiaceae bacterium]